MGVYLVAMWLTKPPRTNFSSRSIMKLLLFNNHIIMAHSDNESELSEAPTTATNPFTIAAGSVASTKIAKHTRNIDSRRPVVPGKTKPKATQQRIESRASDDYSPLVEIPTRPTERPDNEENASTSSESEDPNPTPASLQTPGSESSVSQRSEAFRKRSRARTSTIHEYITVRDNRYIYNRCSRAYHYSDGIGAISRHLKKNHSIDPTVNAIAEKRVQDETDIDTVILREAEVNKQLKGKRRKELMSIGLDKNTLKYLYLQWTVTQNIPFKQVRNKEFRAFLEYVNPVANRMLPKSDFTIKTYAQGLFEEGKKRLRHMLATALSDIHITYDVWKSPNRLGLLAVMTYFTSEKSKLHTVTLALRKL